MQLRYRYRLDPAPRQVAALARAFGCARVVFKVLPNGKLRLPKIGDVSVRWSRPLPSPPSSVTVRR